MGLFTRRDVAARDAIERAHSGPSFSVRDPALAEWLGIGNTTEAGVNVTETSALGLTPVFGAVRLIAGTVAGLPLKTYRKDETGARVQVASVFDNPGGSWLTPYEWKSLVATYMALHGAAPLLHIYNQAGALDSLMPLHPSMVTVDWDKDQGRRVFTVTGDGMSKVYYDEDLTYVMLFSRDGLRGASPLSLARNPIGASIAAEKTAARIFSNGLLISGMITPEDDLDDDQAEELISKLRARLTGTQHAGDIALVSAAMKYQAFSGTSEDMQFFESRQYGVNEAARIFGVPVEMLAQAGATSWGSGIQELVRGFSKFTLSQYTHAMEDRFSRLLSNPRFVEFEYAGLLQASPEVEIPLLLQQIDAGLITVDEARAIRNMPPLNPEQRPADPTNEGEARE